MNLRDYQQSLKIACRNAFLSGYKYILLVLSTGGGKTIIGCSIILDALAKNRRVLITVHRDKLVRNWADDFDKFGIPYGIIQGDYPKTDAPVQIASIDTYINRVGTYGDFDIIIPDEAHRSCAPQYSEIIDYHKKRGAVLVGLTATPHRMDNLGLGNIFDFMVTGVTMLELIKDGFLTDMIIYSANPPDLDMDIKDGEFNKKQYLRKVSGPSRINGIIDICKEHPGKLGVTFAVNIKDANNITAEMNENGISAKCIHSNLLKKTQDKIISDWRNRKFLQLVSVDCITEGFDEVSIQYSIDASPTGSLTKYIQRLGRAIRPWYKEGMPLITREQRLEAIRQGDKPVVYHYDLCGNWWLWGNPWDDHGWSLDGRVITRREMQEKVLSVALCLQCGRSYNNLQTSCPYCGAGKQQRKRAIKTTDGTLTLVTESEAVKAEKEAEERRREKEEAERERVERTDDLRARKSAAKTLEAYEQIERDFGFNRGWGYLNYSFYRKAVDKYRNR